MLRGSRGWVDKVDNKLFDSDSLAIDQRVDNSIPLRAAVTQGDITHDQLRN